MGKLPTPTRVLEQLLEIRDEGACNMFDFNGVQVRADKHEFHHLVCFMEDNKKDWGKIVCGELHLEPNDRKCTYCDGDGFVLAQIDAIRREDHKCPICYGTRYVLLEPVRPLKDWDEDQLVSKNDEEAFREMYYRGLVSG